ncbi:50S ribosomal protein L21e [Candidatus Woesearchaeota archaeon]|nr:50S ribosomal protein L21e [Candidatus Woesearchaeota archaeon]
MAQRIGSSRRKSRGKFTKHPRRRGKVSITRYFQSFSAGDKVILAVEPSVHKGMYFPRFHGRSGIVVGQCGSCYEVEVTDISKKKKLIVHPVHLKRCIDGQH